LKALKKGEKIKYLGVNFEKELVFDKAEVITNFHKDVERLVGTTVLRSDQKLNIINQYLWPRLTYVLQVTPTELISINFLEDIDKIIRSSVKDILTLPSDTPTSFLYGPKRFKGLGLMRAKWESFIQHINMCVTLKNIGNCHVDEFIDFPQEITQSLNKLQIQANDVFTNDFAPKDKRRIGTTLRSKLQFKEFELWSKLPSKGRGVELFKEVPSSNQWIYSKNGLTTSEWINALKMVACVVPVRSVPGRSQDGTLCRHCREPETLSHVLGSCPHGALLRNTRHHAVRSAIAEAIRAKGLQVVEEVHCIAQGGSNRRLDILAYNPETKVGTIIDPTIRFETNINQPDEVNKEKRTIYEPCIEYLKDKYQLNSITVIGVMIGSRGTLTKLFVNFMKQFGLPSKLKNEIVLLVLKGSSQIISNHLYSKIS
jgi:hypothetical protein